MLFVACGSVCAVGCLLSTPLDVCCVVVRRLLLSGFVVRCSLLLCVKCWLAFVFCQALIVVCCLLVVVAAECDLFTGRFVLCGLLTRGFC